MAPAGLPYVQSRAYMDTVVTIQVPRPEGRDMADAVERAFGWFAEVEKRCSRFEPQSELRQLCRQVGKPVQLSPLLYRALEFSLAVAAQTGGVFDPAIGGRMELRGFNRNYRTGEVLTPAIGASDANYTSVTLDESTLSATLLAPLLVDLGAVAKGLAIDLAGRELIDSDGFLLNAGGDIFAHGNDETGGPWRIGIKDPFLPSRLISVLSVSNGSVCTSGGYERPAADGHHIISAADGKSPEAIASVTVVAESAMVADACSTAAFVLGMAAGLEFLKQAGVESMFVDADGSLVTTEGFKAYL